jgi:hypothetical protein
MTVTVLGPQRRPTLSPPPPGTVAATVTAGWRERESDDAELDGLLGGRTVNLRLHARWQDVLEADRELATAELNHRAVLEEMQDLYVLRVEQEERALEAIRRSSARPRAKAAALADAEEMLRLADTQHLARVAAARADFEAAWRPGDRDAVLQQRAQVGAVLRDAGLLVLTGGHVGVLLHVLTLFAVLDPARGTAPADVLAWSAGAMALTERVVLFTDGRAEACAAGLGLLKDTVLLPHARHRLPMDDPARMGALARRFAPARCLVLDDGVHGLERARAVTAEGRVG